MSEESVLETDSSILPSSPKAGVYSVSCGRVIQPATVSPNTLRSFSSSASNTFKPFSYTPDQPSSLTLNNWSKKERNATSLQFQFDSPLKQVDQVQMKQEPIIDEAGYASLIIKQDPVYEPVKQDVAVVQESFNQRDNLYDDVPQSEPDHNYANLAYPHDPVIETRASSASFPDLLQMLTTKNSEQSHENVADTENTDNLYAKVDLSRKRSRPNSSESGDTVVDVTKNNSHNMTDSYTKTIIDKFNLFLEQGGHSSRH